MLITQYVHIQLYILHDIVDRKCLTMRVGLVVMVIMMILIQVQGRRNGGFYKKVAFAPLPPPQTISLACE